MALKYLNLLRTLFSFSFLALVFLPSLLLAEETSEPTALELSESIIEPCREEYHLLVPSFPKRDYPGINGAERLMNQYEADVYAKQSSDLARCIVEKAETSSKSRLKNKKLSVHMAAVDSDYNASMHFEAVVPMWKNADESQVFFLQPGFVVSLTSQSDPSANSNIGAVYRFTFANGVVGINVFYDRSDHITNNMGDHHALQRGSVGVDYQSGRNYFSANYYFPITGWVSVSEFYQEHVVGGLDFHFKRLLTKKISARLGLAYWDYSRSKDRINTTLGLEYNFTCTTFIRTDVEYDASMQDISAHLKFGFKWGEALQKS